MSLSVLTVVLILVVTNNLILPNWAAGAIGMLVKRDFMASLKPVLNRLTLRIATGFTGNINRSVSPQMIISYYDDYRNISNNIYHIGKVVSPPNPNLRWEKTQDIKVALDFGMFNDRLTGIVEGYYRKSKDIVTGVQVLSSTKVHPTEIQYCQY